jgi:hypothetical protein
VGARFFAVVRCSEVTSGTAAALKLAPRLAPRRVHLVPLASGRRGRESTMQPSVCSLIGDTYARPWMAMTEGDDLDPERGQVGFLGVRQSAIDAHDGSLAGSGRMHGVATQRRPRSS